MSIEITVDFIENLRKSRELFNTITPYEIKCISPVICTHICSRKDPYYNRISDYLKFPLKKFNMIAIGTGVAYIYIARCYDDYIDIICPNIEKIIEAIEYLKPEIYEIKVSKYHIIINIKNVHFRFILKHYNSLIDAFDDLSLSAQMIAFDGENILFNAEGKFAYETGYNIVNLKKCHTNYHYELEIYNGLNFGLLHTDLSEINKFDIIHKVIESKFDSLHNLNSLLSGNDDFYMPTTIDEIKTGIVKLRLDPNIFGDFYALRISLMKKYFTNAEIAQMIINEKISMDKFNPLLEGKIIKIEFSDKNDKIHITPEEFYGPDYLYFGQSIKSTTI